MAQTLKFGNGTWATKKGSTLAFNDEDGNYKPLPFTTTRATSATRVNKEGLIEVVENDRPRIDYTDSADGALLLEPTRSNYWTYSEGSAITLNSPLGEFGFHTINNTFLNRAITYVGTINFTFIIKKIDGTIPTITTSSGSGDLVVLVSGSSAAGVAGVLTDIGNGFYKYELTREANGASVARIQNNSGLDTYVSLIQYEDSSHPTSYIPTEGSAVTRVADTASGAGNSEVFNDSEGVFMAEIANISENQTATVAFSLSDGSASNAVSVYYFGTSGLYYDVFNSDGTRSGSTPMTKIQQASNNKISLKYKSGDIALWVNGFKVNTNTGTLNLSGLSELNFDYGNGNFDFYGKTKELAYYDTTLTDAELETLTSYRSLSELVTELNLNTL